VSTDTLEHVNDGSLSDELVSEHRNWLTMERAAYIGLLVLALWIRLLHLGERPLDPDEASQALAAWKLANGVDLAQLGLSPLLLSLQYLTFLLTGASDVAARVWPALVGSSMVAMPCAMRKHLGRGGALFASLLLALSPNLVFFSRQSSAYVLVAAASLGLLVCLVNWVQGSGEDLVAGWWTARFVGKRKGYLGLRADGCSGFHRTAAALGWPGDGCRSPSVLA